jgi:D-sedoheptulose 7-phosphate isomerase
LTYISDYLANISTAISSIDQNSLEDLIEVLKTARDSGATIYTMGNGGSASTASHWVNDLVKGASYQKSKRFRVMCLNDSVPTQTAYSNDVAYEQSLVEPLKNFLRPNDVVIAISGSGNSENVIKAIEYANEAGAKTVGLTGRDGGKLGTLVGLEINVPEQHMGRIEDIHMMITHIASWYFIENEKE